MADLYKGGVQINRAVELDQQPMPVAMPIDTHQDPQNIGDFANNLWGDVKDIGAGLGVAGSVPMARIAENAIDLGGFLNPLAPPNPNRRLPWDFYRPNDGQNLLNMTDMALQGYRDNYIAPLGKGDFATPLKYAGKHPLMFATDVLPFAKSLTEPAKALATSSAVTRATSFLDKAAEKSIPFYSPLKNNIQAARAVQDTATKWNRSFIDEASKDIAAVEDAYNKVPKHLQGKLIEGGELRDLAAHKELSQIPEVQDFWSKANAANDKIAQNLIQAGAMTEQEALIAKYGPYVRATKGLSERALWEQAGYGEILSAKRALDAAGVIPTYFGLMTTPGVKAAIRIKGNMFEKMPDKNFAIDAGQRSYLAKIAKLEQDIADLQQKLKQNPNIMDTELLRKMESELSASKGESAAFHQRVAGNRTEKHATQALQLWEARYLEGLQYLRLKDFFLDLMNNSAIAKPGSVKLDAHAFFNDIATSAGMSPGGVAKFLNGVPETVSLPKMAYDKLMRVMGNSRTLANAGFLGPQAEYVAKVMKTVMLGFDVMWAGYQQGQNAMIYGYAAFQGIHPKEVGASLMGIALAFDKDVRNAAPAWWTADQAATALNAADAAQLVANQSKFAKAVGGIASVATVVTDKVFGMASAGDNFWRSAYANYQMLRQIERAPAGVQHALADAFDIMSNKKELLGAMKDPAKRLSAGVEMEKWFGRYDQLMAQEWRTMRTMVPFWLWIAHAASITASMPTRPMKSLATARIAQIAPRFAQQEGLTESERRRGAILLDRVSPNGNALTLARTGATPFTQTFELANQVYNLANGRADEMPSVPMLNPVFTFYPMIMGVNPQSMRPWKDPHLVQSQGQQYRADAWGELVKVESTHPPLLQLVLRSIFPKIERQAREALAFPNKPTDFTTINDGAIARDREGEPLRNFNAATAMLLEFLKVMPSEQTFTPEDEELMQFRQQKRVNRAAAQQNWRTDRDETSLGRFFRPANEQP